MAKNAKPEGWFVEIRKTSAALHLIAGVQIDLFALNCLLSIAILCFAFGFGAGHLMPLAVLAPAQFVGLLWIFRDLTNQDPWWWQIVSERLAFAARRFLRTRRRRRSNLLRVI